MKRVRTLSEWFEAWFAWLPATAVAWTLSLVLAMLAAAGLALALPQAVAWALAGIAAGGLLGLVQWLALGPQVRGLGLWMLATAVGWVTGLVVAALAVKALGAPWGRLAGGLLGGLLLGYIQWLSLRREAKRTAWMLMTLAGWGVAIAVSLMLETQDWDMLGGTIFNMAVSGAVGLVLLGLVAVPARVVLFPDFGRKDATKYERWWP
jgi:hypothetical protein